MSDDPTVRGPGAVPEGGADDRDEGLAALLAVAPLEDHTRIRLVRRALDEAAVPSPRGRRRARVLSAAAALGLVVTGAAVLATRGGSPDVRGASRAARPGPAAGPPAGIPGLGSAAQVAPHDLGAVGDVTDPARLRQAVGGSTHVAGGSLDEIRAACGTVRLVGGVDRIDTVGTAVDAGQPSVIVVGRDHTGRRIAVIVARRGCAVLQRLALG